MNLVQQFPDVSLQMRNKLKARQRNMEIAIKQVATDSEKALAKYYRDEFRRWHFKLGLIILACTAGIYAAVFAAPAVLEWITS
jgi:hypothetical protein